jgi:hypothetical protein
VGSFLGNLNLCLDANGQESFSATLQAMLAPNGPDGHFGHPMLYGPRLAATAATASLVGVGNKFQIWEPERFCAQLSGATARLCASRKRLGSERAAQGPLGARER